MTVPTPATWRKSSYSVSSTACVELAENAGGVLLRNSKRPEAGTLTVTRAEMAALVAGAKAGELDDLI